MRSLFPYSTPYLTPSSGPPGTGKTSTIAAVLAHWQSEQKGAWVVAHSNVGVKNIAETLQKRGVDFKLIVSHEFYFEWYVYRHTTQLLY